MRETVAVRIKIDEPSLIPVLLANLFHLCCLRNMSISLKYCISYEGLFVEVLLMTFVHAIK